MLLGMGAPSSDVEISDDHRRQASVDASELPRDVALAIARERIVDDTSDATELARQKARARHIAENLDEYKR